MSHDIMGLSDDELTVLHASLQLFKSSFEETTRDLHTVRNQALATGNKNKVDRLDEEFTILKHVGESFNTLVNKTPEAPEDGGGGIAFDIKEY